MELCERTLHEKPHIPFQLRIPAPHSQIPNREHVALWTDISWELYRTYPARFCNEVFFGGRGPPLQ